MACGLPDFNHGQFILLQQGAYYRAAVLVGQHGLKPLHEFNLRYLHGFFLKIARKTGYF